MSHSHRLFITAAAFLLLAAPARADLVPPEVSACAAKQAGAACTNNGPGVCKDSTCSRLDYSKWDRDASSSPPTTTYACLECVNGATATTTATNTTTSTTTTTGGEPTSTATNTATGTKTDDNTSGNGDGWCSIGTKLTAKRIAPWLLAGAFSLLFVYGRRRRG
jgi:hypothetical protein